MISSVSPCCLIALGGLRPLRHTSEACFLVYHSASSDVNKQVSEILTLALRWLEHYPRLHRRKGRQDASNANDFLGFPRANVEAEAVLKRFE